MSGIIGQMLGYVLGTFTRKLIFALGIGFISFQGASSLVSSVQGYINAQMAGIGPIYLEAFNAFGFPQAMSMLFAAYTTKITLIGASKVILKPAGVP